MNTPPNHPGGTTQILDGVLALWAAAIAEQDPERVSGYFTESTLFQGFRPSHSRGRRGVKEYYASQPPGLRAAYEILEAEPLAADLISGYARVNFTFPDRADVAVHLTVILQRVGISWQIRHYHVSPVIQR